MCWKELRSICFCASAGFGCVQSVTSTSLTVTSSFFASAEKTFQYGSDASLTPIDTVVGLFEPALWRSRRSRR